MIDPPDFVLGTPEENAALEWLCNEPAPQLFPAKCVGKRRRKSSVPSGFGVFFLDLPADMADQISDFIEFNRLRLDR